MNIISNTQMNAQMLTLNVGAAMLAIGASLMMAGFAFEWLRRKLSKPQADGDLQGSSHTDSQRC